MCLSGHVVMPVLHPNGEVHNLVVPADQPLSDFHDTLSDYYHAPQPTKEGSLEYSPGFRNAAAEAWRDVGYGNRPMSREVAPEAGFTIGRDGQMGKVEVQQQEQERPGGMRFKVNDNTLATLHTHSDPYSRRPSDIDEKSARLLHTQIYTATKDGLFLTGPDGKTIQVFKRSDWATRKNPE